MANLDKGVQKFVDDLAVKGGKPLYQLEPNQARKVLEDIQSGSAETQGGTLIPPAVIETVIIGNVSVTIVRPGDYRGEVLPAIIYCHGGGWILGSFSTHQRLCSELSNGARTAVVFVNYSRSPEATFPEAIIQIYTVARYVYENGSSMSIDRNRMVIAGDSVGGNMATVVALQAIELGHIRFIYQCLFYPVVDSSFYTGSYQQFANGPWLTRKAMEWFWDAYHPNLEHRVDPDRSPLQTPLEKLSQLPPTLLITDENDVLRDEGESYAHKLMAAGVEVAAVRVLGTMHDFMMLNPLSRTAPTRCAIRLAVVTLREILQGR